MTSVRDQISTAAVSREYTAGRKEPQPISVEVSELVNPPPIKCPQDLNRYRFKFVDSPYLPRRRSFAILTASSRAIARDNAISAN